MIDITYLDGAKQERVMHFDSYDEFERSQQACLIGVADFYPVVKLTIMVMSWITKGLTGMFSSIS